MNEETFPAPNVVAQQITEFVEVNGQRVPKHLYMMHMNRKQKRQFEAELRKKNSHVKLVRVENNITEEDSVEVAEVIEENTASEQEVVEAAAVE